MTTKTLCKNNRRDFKSFQYALEDYLEFRTQIGQNSTLKIRKFFSNQNLKELEIQPLEGFSLDHHIVLFRPGTGHPYKNLVFLNPLSGFLHSKTIT